MVELKDRQHLEAEAPDKSMSTRRGLHDHDSAHQPRELTYVSGHVNARSHL